MGKQKRKKRKGVLPKVIQSEYDSSKKKKKKKILYHSDFALLNTGFGGAAKLILTYLYNTGKYDLVNFCCGMTKEHPDFQRLPWKSIGALPQDIESNEAIKRDPKLAQMASYGSQTIDQVMREERPDIYIGVQDIWGCDFATKRSWYSKPNMAIWTTLDSLPILPMAEKAAAEADNFWCWSEFATRGLHKLGHKHVKTLHGPLDESNYFKLNRNARLENRKRFGISDDTFIVGFVFRNQLRKSVPNLLEGFKKFLDKNPEAREKGAKLLLHTNFSEGWNIHKLAKEVGVSKDDIITTYTCGNCFSYGIHPFQGQQLNCPHCGGEKTYATTGITQGVSEKQLNEVYNFMDVYCHPFTSGGQEIPVQEAKLVELITLVTNYSCGEDSCAEEAASLPLTWSEYREHGTEFIKASTSPDSIAKQLDRVYAMPDKEREEMGATARKWVIDNFSINKIAGEIEEFIDSVPFLDKDFVYTVKSTQNPLAVIDDKLSDDLWLVSMYKNILDMEVDEKDAGHKYWTEELKKGVARSDVSKFFRETAKKELESTKSFMEDVFSKEEKKEKKILFVIPETAGDIHMATSLFQSLNEQYPDYKLYVAVKPTYTSIVQGNPYVYRVIDYDPRMENTDLMEGHGHRGISGEKSVTNKNHEGHFDICFLSHVNTQRISCYTHNGLDKIAFNLVDF